MNPSFALLADSFSGSAKCMTSPSGHVWGDESGNSIKSNGLSVPFDIVPALYRPEDEALSEDISKDRYEAEKHTLVSFKMTGSDDTHLRHQSYYLRPFVLILDPDKPLARLDASFYMTHKGGTKYSFRSINYDTFFINPVEDNLKISEEEYIWDVGSCTSSMPSMNPSSPPSEVRICYNRFMLT